MFSNRAALYHKGCKKDISESIFLWVECCSFAVKEALWISLTVSEGGSEMQFVFGTNVIMFLHKSPAVAA